MRLACIHCGKDFSITAEQLGGTGRCPHCRSQITLPKAGAVDEEQKEDDDHRPSAWLENSISGLGSFVVHLILTLILAMIIRGGGSGESSGETYDVFIGELATENLTNEHDDKLEETEVENVSEENFEEPLDQIE